MGVPTTVPKGEKMKTYDGYQITVGHQYFIVSIKSTGAPTIDRSKFKIGILGCKCASCKKAECFKLSKGGIITLDTLKYYDDHFFKKLDAAKQFCLNIMEDFQECLNKEVLSIQRISKESLI